MTRITSAFTPAIATVLAALTVTLLWAPTLAGPAPAVRTAQVSLPALA